MSTRLLKHLPTVVVAVAVLGLAFADGAYDLTARGILAIALWWAIILGLGLGLLPFRRPSREAYLVGALLATLGLLAALSTTWSLSAERSFVEFNRISLYLGVFILAVLAGRRESLSRWADGLAIGIGAIGLLALASGLFPDLVKADEQPGSLPQGHLAFPFGYWNALGVLLAMGLPLLVRTAATARSLVLRGVAVGLVPVLGSAIFFSGSRSAAGAAIVGMLALLVLVKPRAAAIWATASATAGTGVLVASLAAQEALFAPADAPRAAAAQGRSIAVIVVLVCVAVGVAYAGGLVWARSRNIRLPRVSLGRPGWAGLGAVALVLLVAGAVAADPGAAVDRFRQTGFEPGEMAGAGGFSSFAGGGRYQLWSAALDEFRAYPVLGGGAGSYESWWAANPQLALSVRNAHSLYLETLGELGLPGLLLLVGALAGGLVVAGGRLRRLRGPERATLAALCAVVVTWAIAAGLDWMWEIPLITGLAILCLGFMVGPATALETSPAEAAAARARRGRRSFSLGVAVIAAAWLVICAQGAPLLSELRLQDSRRAAAGGDFDAAAAAARGANLLQPWAATPYRQLALVERDRGRPEAARRLIDEAIEREPANYELWEIAARIEADAGNDLGARQRRQRSRSLNPLFAARGAPAG